MQRSPRMRSVFTVQQHLRWRILTLIIVLVVGVMGSTTVARAVDGELLAVVAELYEAFNAGDLDGLVTIYADDATIEVGPFATYSGTEEIRGWAAPQMDANAQLEYVVMGEDEETQTVTVQSTYTSDIYDYPLEATEEYVIEDGVITSHKWIPSEETLALLEELEEQEQRARRLPEDVISAAYTAFNIGDLDRFLNQYAETAVIDVSTFGVYSGTEEISTWVKPQMDARARLTYEILDVQDGEVTVLSTYTSNGFDFPLDATEIYEVVDGEITSHIWTPDEETIQLLEEATLAGRTEQAEEPFGDSTNLAGTYGLMVEGSFYITDEEGGETNTIPFAIAGTLVADGDGFLTRGARTLNFAGEIQTDTVTGSYIVEEDGRFSLTLNAFQEGKYVAMEEYACFATEQGDRFECLMTEVLQIDVGPDPVSSPVLALAHGLRLAELGAEVEE